MRSDGDNDDAGAATRAENLFRLADVDYYGTVDAGVLSADEAELELRSAAAGISKWVASDDDDAAAGDPGRKLIPTR